ncbi:MAG: AraC-like DNA-binding protein [Reinekea sp.]|jgi:AraC-like DNA-binding protein
MGVEYSRIIAEHPDAELVAIINPNLACWLTGETPMEVFTSASCLVDEQIGAAGDVDTAMPILKMPSGVLCHINNSRKAVYGFDQRRVAELLFVYALRHILQNQTDLSFLGLYVSNSLKAAIQLIHQQPHIALPLDKLAEACSMSRTVFAQTFKANSGWTPAQYITWWRMQLAWGKLEQGERISLVATDVGYQSEAAFSRVFKKIFGMSPGRVRGKSLA